MVDDKLNDVGLATLEFDTSYLQVRDAGTFWLESEVSVHLGYKDDCQQVFVGEVTEFIQEYKEYGHQRLKVVCKNCLHRLQNAHQALSFEFKTLSEALVSRLESYGIKAQVDSFGTKKYFVKSQITDYEFLMESANKYGKTVYAHGNKVYVKDEVTICNEDVVLEWGKSLVYFRGRESLQGQLSGCSFVGWDSRKGQGITGRVSLGEVPVKVGGGRSWEDNSKAAGGRWHSTIMEESLRDREEAVVLAKAYLQNLSMQYQMAECKCEGDQRILPGMRMTVKYVGDSYSGEYIANHVIHEFSVYGGYTTTLYLKRNMAGGEKKRVSPIDSDMMRERLRRMEERMHGPVDQEQVAVHEVESSPAAETAPPAESQETGEEDNDSLQGEIRNDDMEFESRNQIDSQTAADENDYHCDIYSWNAALNSGHDPRGQNGEAWDGNNETVAQIYERYPDNRNNGIPPANTRGYAFYDSPNDNDNVPEHMEFYDNTNFEAGGYTLYRTDGIEIPEPQQRGGMDNNRVFIPLDNLPEGDD